MTSERPVLQVLAKLGAVKRMGSGWSGRCPAHEDSSPSLSVGEGADQRVLLTCHAGCTLDEILAALGLSTSELFASNGDAHTTRPIEVDAYDYTDEEGTLLYQVVRYSPKAFKQRRPDGAGGWEWNLRGTRRVLYRWPAVVAAAARGDTIYVVEGEKDVAALEAAGEIATCNPGGAGKWRDDYAETLSGAHVVVVADRDEKGRNHAQAVAASVAKAAASVRVVEPLEGKDAHDHLVTYRHAVSAFVDTNEASVETVELDVESPADLLDAIASHMRRYVFMGEHEVTAVSLFVAATHAADCFNVAPYLEVKSAEAGCGKSLLLEVMSPLVRTPWLALSPSEAVLFRVLHAKRPTLLLDECDALFKGSGDRSEPIRAVLNAGYRKGFRVPRCAAKTFELVEYDVFGPKAFAGIRNLPDTVASRAIPIELRRLAASEWVEPYDTDEVAPVAAGIKEALRDWIEELGDDLKVARPEIPVGLRNRRRETWKPLLAIADAAGSDWPRRARAAAAALARGEDDASAGILLLSHIRDAFEAAAADQLPTAELLAALCDREDGPWADWWSRDVEAGRTKGPASRLARMLKAYPGIKPQKIRTASGTAQGYRLTDFTDAFSRYVPTDPQCSDLQLGTTEQPSSEAVFDRRATEPHTGPDLQRSVVPTNASEHKQGTEQGRLEVCATSVPAVSTFQRDEAADQLGDGDGTDNECEQRPAHDQHDYAARDGGTGRTPPASTKGTFDDLDAAARLVQQELAGVVVSEIDLKAGTRRCRPGRDELLAAASERDFPRVDLPDGSTILAGEEFWKVFSTVALPSQRYEAMAALRSLIGAET